MGFFAVTKYMEFDPTGTLTWELLHKLLLFYRAHGRCSSSTAFSTVYFSLGSVSSSTFSSCHTEVFWQNSHAYQGLAWLVSLYHTYTPVYALALQ